MTIREFSQLCGCNPQTLRYYDHVDLLKPAAVDPWSGYRYYEEDQALAFVRIRNLQKAGFTLEEIRELRDQDDSVICQAFDAKIAEAEDRLREIRLIRQSYQTEMKKMMQKLEEIRETITGSMKDYDPAEEFGMTREAYDEMIRAIDEMMERTIRESEGNVPNLPFVPDLPEAPEEKNVPDLDRDPMYEKVYEKHGWAFVKDFFDEFADLESGREYVMMFRVQPEKARGFAFPNVALSLLMARNEGRDRAASCHVVRSKDGQNHFALYRKKIFA